ncbi:glycine cleavage system protein R [Glaciecola siphonariae]|uniref:Glycine cleavage system protein R n=1 Tax=Glaciecola siphonariae TaxID=521012 RepID=A0ABV9LTN2_9ALTE
MSVLISLGLCRKHQRMKTQLIVNILGADKLGILSTISGCISDHSCNILDSRHAIYGQDFSVTMIASGSEHDITRLEIGLSSLCVEHELLCMMKRTSGHIKQNIEQLISLKFAGQDSAGLMQRVTKLLAGEHVSISAVRQKVKTKNDVCFVECKMILSAPADLDLVEFDKKVKAALNGLGLSGRISHQQIKEDNEHIESW